MINGEVQAILLRVPANVVGDGVRTVEELVAEKNLDPLRGTNHRAPLELIQLGELEQLMLKEQGLTVSSVPAKDKIVYLRENSNISTGGDSIDVTDEFSEEYKQIAVSAVEALGAKISGIDLIIPDKEVDPRKIQLPMESLKRTLIQRCICMSIHLQERQKTDNECFTIVISRNF